MSGVLTPPPRPQRPYLPTQNGKNGSKSLAKTPEGVTNKEASDGHGRSTGDTTSTSRRSHTFSDSSDVPPPRPQRPMRKPRTGSESSGRESLSPERPISPSSKPLERQVEKRTNAQSPLRKSFSQVGAQDDLERRRWSYGFENDGNPKSSYHPRAPPPCPPRRQLSSPDASKAMQSSHNGLRMPRRSYTFGSAKSLPSYPMHHGRMLSFERETSASPERQVSPGPLGSVEIMRTVEETSHTTDSSLNKSAPPSRPSRPPPPKAKSLPRGATSLTTHRNQQDGNPEQGRPHSKSEAEGQMTTVTRPLSPQRAAIDQSSTEPNENGQETGVSPEETMAEAPAVPPRPFLPPRPFPPGQNAKERAKSTRKKPTKRSNPRPVDKTRVRPRSGNGNVTSASDSAQLQPVQVPPESLAREPVPVSNDTQETEKEPPVSFDPPVSNNKDAVQPLQNTDDLPPESSPAQEQSNAPNSEEPLASPKQPSSPMDAIIDVKEDLSKALEDEEDQISPLPTAGSPQPKGNRFMKSMRKTFRSLRSPRRKRKQPSMLSGRPYSETDIVVPEKSGNYPDPLPRGIIDPLVIQCVAYLNKDSVLREEGLFRIPGDVATIKKLRERFINGFDVDLSEIVDPHTVAGLLKLHFREQRVSMIPRGQTLASITQAVKEKNVESVRELVNSIDVTHIAMLRLVAELLTMVVSFCDENKMTSGTLATSCAPSVFPYLPTSCAVIVMKFLIDNCEEIFQQ